MPLRKVQEILSSQLASTAEQKKFGIAEGDYVEMEESASPLSLTQTSISSGV